MLDDLGTRTRAAEMADDLELVMRQQPRTPEADSELDLSEWGTLPGRGLDEVGDDPELAMRPQPRTPGTLTPPVIAPLTPPVGGFPTPPTNLASWRQHSREFENTLEAEPDEPTSPGEPRTPPAIFQELDEPPASTPVKNERETREERDARWQHQDSRG